MDRHVVIAGTGRYLGDQVFSVEDILRRSNIDPANITDENVRELVSKSYRVRRRVSDPRMATSDLFVEAGKKALKSAGVGPEEVDLMICVTDTPDYLIPSTSARVQHGLGAVNAGFFDLNSACAGFPIALTLANSFLQSTDEARYVLVIGGNLYSRYLNPADLAGQLLFSDSAAAVVLKVSASVEHGIRKSTISGDGRYWHYWGVFAGGTWKGFSQEALDQGFQYLKLVQPYDKDVHIKTWVPIIEKTLKKTGWNASEIDRAFLTQSRPKSLPAICEAMGWDPAISYNTGNKFGYLGSACIPAALDDAVENGVLKPGQKILVLASGLGYSCCAVTLVWGTT